MDPEGPWRPRGPVGVLSETSPDLEHKKVLVQHPEQEMKEITNQKEPLVDFPTSLFL